jgi:hypothetical protein
MTFRVSLLNLARKAIRRYHRFVCPIGRSQTSFDHERAPVAADSMAEQSAPAIAAVASRTKQRRSAHRRFILAASRFQIASNASIGMALSM